VAGTFMGNVTALVDSFKKEKTDNIIYIQFRLIIITSESKNFCIFESRNNGPCYVSDCTSLM
jgi:hypothetical protein